MTATLLLAPAAADARTRKGEKFMKEGRAAEARQEWDAALGLYEQAVGEDPSDISYMLAMRRVRFQAGQKHVDNGQKLRNEGKLNDALMEFQRALVADPSSAIALQEIKRIQDMQRAPQSGVRPQDLNLTPAERERRASDERVSSMLQPPELKPMTLVVPTLKMNNQPPKILYDTVGKLAGVNVVFDSQYNPPGRNFNVDLSNVTAEQAFDYLALLTHTFWKPITANTIFVTDDNVTKRRDYEDDVVKVFYVTNATSVQEFQEIATAIRTVAEIRRVFTYNAQRAMIVRDTVDKVALAEKLIHDLDKPKAEVVVDVIVMEANSQRTRDLAATIISAGTAGLTVPINFNPNNSAVPTPGNGGTLPATTNTIPLSQLGKLSTNQFTTTLPGGLLQALLSDSRTRVMNNPQVRASDGQKVSLKIGSRYPYATGSFQTNTAAALVSTQFNYADVGVNVDMTPQVHSADEVTLHVEVTVSAITGTVAIGDIKQPIIGQRANIADIRLREGEVNILGGLSTTQDTATSNGIPGLIDIPVLGHILFGNDHKDVSHGDLLIALVPHIVRTPDYTAENLRGIYAGTDQVVKINYAPKPLDGAAAPPPAPVKPATGSPATPVAPRATSLPPLQPAAPVAPGSARITFAPPSLMAAEGGTITVAVQLENVTNLAEVSTLQLKYDPDQLRLNDILPGDLLSRDGVTAVNTVKDIRNDAGEASITLTRPSGASGISGSGPIAVLNFTATGSGMGSVRVTELGLKSAQGQPISAALGEVPVTVP